METKLTAVSSTEVKRLQSDSRPQTVTTAEGGEISIPYWCIVVERGAVRGDKMVEQATQEAKLVAEGHTFEFA